MRVAVTSLISVRLYGTIFSGLSESGGSVRVRLYEQLHPVVGDVLEIDGEFGTYRDRWGREHAQFEAKRADRVQTSGKLVLPWLENLKGLGPVRARRLAAAFGSDLADALSDPENLDEIGRAVEPDRPGVGRIVAAAVIAEMAARRESDGMAEAELRFRQRLEGYGVQDPRAVRRLWRLIGSRQAEERLLERPYLAAAVLPWAEADHIGLRLLAQRGDVGDPTRHPERLAGACDAAWAHILAGGDTACDPARFRPILRRLLKHPVARVDTSSAIEVGLETGAVVERDGLFRAPGAAWIEDDLARRLALVRDGDGPISIARDVEGAVRAAEVRSGLVLTPEQRGAVAALLGRKLAVLQGNAGTGKSTVMRVVAEAWEAAGGNLCMACISGKAALQLSRATSTPDRPRLARTVARTLADLRRGRESGDFMGSGARIDARTLMVVDEASMVDTPSLHELVAEMPPGARLLLVGDEGQLPPVGIGRVFHDLVADGRHVSTLHRVLRQAEDNPIPRLAAEIRQGRSPTLPGHRGAACGVTHLPCGSEGVFKAVVKVWEDLGGARQPGELLVCAALRRTVEWVNEAAVEATGGRGHRTRIGPLNWVGVGDPVVATKNHYAAGIFNGQIGTVHAINDDALMVAWEGEEAPCAVAPDVLPDLDLAFAVTCHRAQGSSARRVIIPLEETRLLTRQWLYTAVTRAREQAVLVGPAETLAAAVGRTMDRVTGFRLGA